MQSVGRAYRSGYRAMPKRERREGDSHRRIIASMSGSSSGLTSSCHLRSAVATCPPGWLLSPEPVNAKLPLTAAAAIELMNTGGSRKPTDDVHRRCHRAGLFLASLYQNMMLLSKFLKNMYRVDSHLHTTGSIASTPSSMDRCAAGWCPLRTPLCS